MQTYNFADTGQTARSRLHHELALALAERIRELVLVVLVDQVPEPWLATELVNSLRDFVACCVAETGEERQELAPNGSGCVFTEDDGAQASL